jgi:hypothetical protein
MFKLDKSKRKMLDSSDRVVGYVINGYFTQNGLIDPSYQSGLTALELEQLSEAMQRSLSRSEA